MIFLQFEQISDSSVHEAKIVTKSTYRWQRASGIHQRRGEENDRLGDGKLNLLRDIYQYRS